MFMHYIKPRKYKNISRYQIYRQISDDSVYTETFNQTKIDQNNDVYHEVSSSEENRLDIISNKYYSSPDFYWAIALANDIIDPFDVPQGMILRIPKINSLFNYKGPLYSRI